MIENSNLTRLAFRLGQYFFADGSQVLRAEVGRRNAAHQLHRFGLAAHVTFRLFAETASASHGVFEVKSQGCRQFLQHVFRGNPPIVLDIAEVGGGDFELGCERAQ